MNENVLISLRNVAIDFDGERILHNIDLDINDKEFVTFLGPSGCGKTTTLRIIGGFVEPTEGDVFFDGKRINDVPPYKRQVNTVFQRYALFPHLNVFENVEFGLKLHKVPEQERRTRVKEMLELVNLKGFEHRSINRLSGGQQQRVALARAIVIHPSVLLMDEPLSNLDAKLRIEMRSTIRELQKEIGITTVYVTHDQEEALAISDRIAVMNKGEIQQLGRPLDIYLHPANTFVATFIGFSNLFAGKLKIENGKTYAVLNENCVIETPALREDVQDGMDIVVSMRPDEFVYADKGLRVKLRSSTFLGQTMSYKLDFLDANALDINDENELTEAIRYVNKSYQPGDEFCVMPIAEKINVFTGDGAESLLKDVKKYGE